MVKKLNPIYTGEVMRKAFFLLLGISSSVWARVVQVTPAFANEIVPERCSISADPAARLARFFATNAQRWMNLQIKVGMEAVQPLASPAIAHTQPWQVSRHAVPADV
jgi:addiction module HigA family antidote